jgi:hypothetical protein
MFINQKKHEAENNPVPELEDDIIPERSTLLSKDLENSHIEEDNMLYIDVKIEEDRKARIVIKQTDDPAKLAHDFVTKHGLDQD